MTIALGLGLVLGLTTASFAQKATKARTTKAKSTKSGKKKSDAASNEN
jgi:hypothetical protein